LTDARRGEVWLVDFGVPVGREGGYVRPAVVISSDMLNAGPGGVVVVVPTTTARRDLPLHVEIDPGESGLDETSYAKCEDVKSVSVERMVRRFGVVPPEVVHRISRTLRYVLEL
jgi:mRNA interferase MazF